MKLGQGKQVSDIVPAKTVKGFVANCKCERDDCVISVEMGESTCMGHGQQYNREGILQVRNENHFRACLTCLKCWKTEIVNENGEYAGKS